MLQSGSRVGWGTVCEISLGGCYIETDKPLPSGTEVQLRLTIANTKLFIGAKVVFDDPVAGMAIDFMVMPPEQRSKLAEIIEKIKASKPSLLGVQAEQVGRGHVFRFAREAAPDILEKIIKRIEENGVLTRRELVDIVKASRSTPTNQ
jgi:hypothetical protein